MLQALASSACAMAIVKCACVMLLGILTGTSSSLGSSGCQVQGVVYLGRVARDFAMGGTSLSELIPEAPQFEVSFCVSRHDDLTYGTDGGFSIWSIPHIGCSFPVRTSIVGFRRYSTRDCHRRRMTEDGISLRSGTLWNNSVFWNHPFSTGVLISIDTGLLTGRVMEKHLCSTHTYSRGRTLTGEMVGGRVLLTGRSHAVYGGIRWYHVCEHDAEILVGLEHEGTRVCRRMEISLHPLRFSRKGAQNVMWFHFGAEERISQAVLFRYGFALTPEPSLFCLTSGCGICDKLMSVDTAVGWYCFETEHLFQLITTVSLKL